MQVRKVQQDPKALAARPVYKVPLARLALSVPLVLVLHGPSRNSLTT